MPGFGRCGLDATLPNAALRALVKTRSSRKYVLPTAKRGIRLDAW
jgi:hypothetical protein